MNSKSKATRKIWIGVGAFVVAGSSTVDAGAPPAAPNPAAVSMPHGAISHAAIARGAGFRIAQHADHNNKDAGEGGESKNLANLPPDLAFAVRLALLRGHLLVGDELVKQKQWNAALPHFLHP